MISSATRWACAAVGELRLAQQLAAPRQPTAAPAATTSQLWKYVYSPPRGGKFMWLMRVKSCSPTRLPNSENEWMLQTGRCTPRSSPAVAARSCRSAHRWVARHAWTPCSCGTSASAAGSCAPPRAFEGCPPPGARAARGHDLAAARCIVGTASETVMSFASLALVEAACAGASCAPAARRDAEPILPRAWPLATLRVGPSTGDAMSSTSSARAVLRASAHAPSAWRPALQAPLSEDLWGPTNRSQH